MFFYKFNYVILKLKIIKNKFKKKILKYFLLIINTLKLK